MISRCGQFTVLVNKVAHATTSGFSEVLVLDGELPVYVHLLKDSRFKEVLAEDSSEAKLVTITRSGCHQPTWQLSDHSLARLFSRIRQLTQAW